MIKLSKSDYEKILHHAESELPNEACGLIGGVKEGSDKIIKKVYLLTNIEHSNEHFSLDPKEQLAAIKDMRQRDLFLWATGTHTLSHLLVLLMRIKGLLMTRQQAI